MYKFKYIYTLSIVFFSLTVFTSCSDVAGPESGSDIVSEEFERQSNFLDKLQKQMNIVPCGFGILKAGKKTVAGNVNMEYYDGILTVTYTSAEDWGISETHLWVGKTIEDMPKAGNGAPKNGHFPYGNSYNPAQSSISYEIDLEAKYGISEGEPFVVVAHAVTGKLKNGTLKKTETAYAGDKETNSKRWFYYMEANCTPSLSGDSAVNAGVSNGF